MPIGSPPAASLSPQDKSPLIVWRLVDGKPGHEKQTLGLAQALLEKRHGECITLRVPSRFQSWMNWITGRFPAGTSLPPPDLILSAGHATHFALLAARRAFGGRAIVLMKPSLPCSLFDLCLIPEHDQPPSEEGVIATRGVLNNLVDRHLQEPTRGLLLIGGPSPHFAWDSDAIRRQVIQLTEKFPDIRWVLTTSRRTPSDFLDGLGALPAIECIPAEKTSPGWLEKQMDRAMEAWCTPDSVSMVYEALTAGCRVGLLELPAVAGSRVADGVKILVSDGEVSSLRQVQAGLPTGAESVHQLSPPAPIDEATRCAGVILKKWFE